MEPYVHPDGTLSLLPPPEHYVVDFENPQRQWVIEAYSITGGLNLVMLVFVAQRTYVKLWVHKKVDWDDGMSPPPFFFPLEHPVKPPARD